MKLSARFIATTACVISVLSIVLATAALASKSTTKKPVTPAKQPQAPVVDRRLSRGESVAREALSYRGGRYRWGGTTPRGFDCSGLTQAVCRDWGLMLPRTSVEQFSQGIPVPKDQLLPGDLVFFKNTYKKGISHVGIYIGGGEFVHAASSSKGIIVTPLSEPHYANRYAGARRIAFDKAPMSAQAQPSTKEEPQIEYPEAPRAIISPQRIEEVKLALPVR